MADRIGVLSGTFLKPGISLNRRIYTTDNIGKAVERMNGRIQAGKSITMMASHLDADKDDATRTVGTVTKVWQRPDGSGAFEADILGTAAGKDIAVLVNPQNPVLKTVSIRGAWVGDPIKVTAEADGKAAWTSDDLDVEGIDWTGRPGVEGAQVDNAQVFESKPENAYMIRESVEDAVFTEEVVADPNAVQEGGNAPGNGKLPYGTNGQYADPGYQKDKKKRYPLNSTKRIRAAWAYINKAKNAAAYTSAQLARIKSKIKSAAKKAGVDIAAEAQAIVDHLYEGLMSAAMVAESGEEFVSEDAFRKMAEEQAYEMLSQMYPLDEAAPDDNNMDAADNDNDAATDTDNDGDLAPMCDFCGEEVPQLAMYCPTCGQPVPQAESDETASTEMEEATVADPNATEPSTTEATAKYTDEDLERIVAERLAAAETARATEATSTETPASTETPDNSTQESEPVTDKTSEVLEFLVESMRAKEARKADKRQRKAEESKSAEAALEARIAEERELAAAEAEERIRKEAVAAYRSEGSALRKGLVSQPEEAEELDPEALAKMSPSKLRETAMKAFAGAEGQAWATGITGRGRGKAPRLAEALAEVPQAG